MKLTRLKAERKQRGWSQAKVAEALGVNLSTVLRWEQGQTMPYPYYRQQLCALFGKTVEELGLLPDADAHDDGHAKEETPSPVAVADPSEPDVTAQAAFIADPIIPRFMESTESLLGRHDLLIQVKERLFAEGTLSLIALHGLPGVGKTALAVALATDQDVLTHFGDGVLWASLGPHPNVLGQLARWGKLLGVVPSQVGNIKSREAWGRCLRAAIGTRRLLLIIDDAWTTKDALALLVGGTQCAYLLTTRLPLVASTLAQEGAIVVPGLKDASGLALLARFVPQLVDQDSQGAQALVQAVGGLPLAVVLIGNYLASHLIGQPQPLQAALAEFYETEQRLRAKMPEAPGQHSASLVETGPLSLHTAIAISDAAYQAPDSADTQDEAPVAQRWLTNSLVDGIQESGWNSRLSAWPRSVWDVSDDPMESVSTFRPFRRFSWHPLLMVSITSLCVFAITVLLVFNRLLFPGSSTPTTNPRISHITTVIDDSIQGTSTNQFNYVGTGWLHCTGGCRGYPPDAYNGSNSWDNLTNNYVNISFTGVQIKLYGVLDQVHGIGAVSVDGSKETMIDFYAATETGNRLLWTSPLLPVGPHNFKLRVTGNKNPSSSGAFVVVDRVDILS